MNTSNHKMTREQVPGKHCAETRVVCSCGWKSHPISPLSDNYMHASLRDLERIHRAQNERLPWMK